MLLKLQVFLLDLIDRDAYDVDHVSEDGSADDLDQSDHDGLHEVVGSEVAISHCHHGRIGPVEGVDVVDVPRTVLQLCLLQPVLTPTGADIDHRVHDQRLREGRSTKR
jgi:hypothetical protein